LTKLLAPFKGEKKPKAPKSPKDKKKDDEVRFSCDSPKVNVLSNTSRPLLPRRPPRRRLLPPRPLLPLKRPPRRSP